jgi:hypothetical protein
MPVRPTFSLALALAVSVVLAACDSTPVAVPIEARVVPVPRPEVVRGIYVNAQAAGSPAHVAELLVLADGSQLNSFVIDVKERGEVSYASAVPLTGAIGSVRGDIDDLPGLLGILRDRGIYPIARIVCFSDPVLAGGRPEWAIRTVDGGVWRDPESGASWVDPFNPDVWAYNIDLAREALELGFAEIQWDYVRFPDVVDSVRADMVFPARAGRSTSQAISDFIAESRTQLAAFEAPITADVFGRVITTSSDSVIGQDWDRLVRATDVLLPMVYPSLYGPDSFGLPDPSAEPYHTVRAAMDSAVARLDRTDGAIATIRPWLQAFTLESTVYGVDQMRAQIQAVEDAGLTEWFFWNPDSRYPAGLF